CRLAGEVSEEFQLARDELQTGSGSPYSHQTGDIFLYKDGRTHQVFVIFFGSADDGDHARLMRCIIGDAAFLLVDDGPHDASTSADGSTLDLLVILTGYGNRRP